MNTQPCPSANATAAPSSGCSAGVCPNPAGSPDHASDSNQNRRRWNAYVGNSTHRRAPPLP
ncbi:hypothetical protein, partial [Streptomyces palmae]|uniref:hypothetical protein n=1 Tax=Streptomyces palmae TaxID=1701085 RepID=UPI001FD84A4A